MIICAATMLENVHTGKIIMLRVHRHGDAYATLRELGFQSVDFRTIEQGFIGYEQDPNDEFTGTEFFLNRKEALVYAKKIGQISSSMSDEELYSEDLW